MFDIKVSLLNDKLKHIYIINEYPGHNILLQLSTQLVNSKTLLNAMYYITMQEIKINTTFLPSYHLKAVKLHVLCMSKW